MAGFTQYVEPSILRQQSEAVFAAQNHAEQLMLTGLGDPPPGVTVTFAKAPTQAINSLIGFTGNGSPLRKLLDELGPDASARIRTELITGLALGQHPNVIARRCRDALGGNMMRALTISRTEVLRAYRESAHLTYQANADILEGWVWHSAANSRTCAMCWAQHGTIHPLDERLTDHPRGRCTALPRTKSWEEILGKKGRGIPDSCPPITKGSELFEKLSPEVQQSILGKSGYLAYKNGQVKLSDFIGKKHSKEWGTTHYARSLREILGPEEAKKVIAQATEEAVATRKAARLELEREYKENPAAFKAKREGEPVKAYAMSGRGKTSEGSVGRSGDGMGSGGGGGMSGSGGSGKRGGRPPGDRHNDRQFQLNQMADEQLKAEVRGYQAPNWSPKNLNKHVQRHATEIEQIIGHTVDQAEYEALSKEIVRNPDRVFTGIDEVTEGILYVFTRSIAKRSVIILVLTEGGGTVRTMFPVKLSRWLKSNPEMIEVTSRVR